MSTYINRILAAGRTANALEQQALSAGDEATRTQLEAEADAVARTRQDLITEARAAGINPDLLSWAQELHGQRAARDEHTADLADTIRAVNTTRKHTAAADPPPELATAPSTPPERTTTRQPSSEQAQPDRAHTTPAGQDITHDDEKSIGARDTAVGAQMKTWQDTIAQTLDMGRAYGYADDEPATPGHVLDIDLDSRVDLMDLDADVL